MLIHKLTQVAQQDASFKVQQENRQLFEAEYINQQIKLLITDRLEIHFLSISFTK